jgi:hypothetical protein
MKKNQKFIVVDEDQNGKSWYLYVEELDVWMSGLPMAYAEWGFDAVITDEVLESELNKVPETATV